MLARETLRRLWPRCHAAIVDGIADNATAVFSKYGLTTPLSVAVFMAHASNECGAGTELVENGNYSVARIVAVWPSRFHSVAEAMPYAHNSRKLFNKVYGSRMGNRPGTDDGYNNRGRGLTNVTGAEGYAKLAAKTGLDLINNPNLVNDPAHILECGVADFVLCGCVEPALKGDMRTSTRRLNGGYIGLANREQWFRKWQSALAAEHGADAIAPAAPAKVAGTQQFGDTGFEVAALQKQLNDKGYSCGSEDGDFYESTKAAVNAFKSDAGLPTDGIADQATKDALAVADNRPVSEARATASLADLRDKGSRTIEATDRLGLIGKFKMVIGGLGFSGAAAEQSGLLSLDGIQDKIDKAHQAYGIVDSLKDTLKPLLDSPMILWGGLALGVLGLLVLFEAHKVAVARLDDHRSAANLGR